MPWYPSAKACPAAIKPTVQCFFPTLYQVLLFDFSSFGEKLFFCLRGYAAQSREARCKKQPEHRARLFLCLPAAEQAANGWSPQPCPTPSRLCRAIAQSAMQKTAGAPSEAVPLSSRRRTGGEWLEPVTLPYPQQAMPPHTPLKHPAMYTYPTKFMHNLCHIVM